MSLARALKKRYNFLNGGAFALDLAAGNILGMKPVKVVGRNPLVSQTGVPIIGVPADIWDGGGLYSGFGNLTASPLRLVSTSVNDSIAGTGARQILVRGLNANYEEISEIVNMNGDTTNGVVTSSSFLRTLESPVVMAGSGKKNDGIVTCSKASDSNIVFFKMIAGKSITNVAAYTVPAGHTLFVTAWHANIGKGSGSANFDREAIMEFKIISPVANTEYLYKPENFTNRAKFREDFKEPYPISEKRDCTITITYTSHDLVDISGGFDGVLVSNAMLAT